VSSNDEGERHSTNQLKYANKQLYRESAGLELQLNTIIVEDYNTESTAQHFLKFTNFCTPTRLGWFTSIVLEQKRGDTNARLRVWLRLQMQTIAALFDFAAAHPHMKISLRAPDFNMKDVYYRYEAFRFLHDGVILTRMFRGKDIAGLMGMNAVAFQTDCDYALGVYKARVERIRNRAGYLRFLPWAVE
jgi:hypothetical protein